MRPLNSFEEGDLASVAPDAGGLASANPAGARFEFWPVLGAEDPYVNAAYLKALQPDGIVIEMRSRPAAQLTRAAAGIRDHATQVAVDPVTYFAQEPLAARYARYTALPWGSQPPPAVGTASAQPSRRAMCASILDYVASTAPSADVVIAPYFVQRSRDPVDWVTESMSCAQTLQDEIVRRREPRTVWAAAAVTEAALIANLHSIAAALRASPTPVLYLLIRTAQASSTPLGDVETLEAMRTLIGQVASAGIAVVVGRRYSSGLVLGALGAAGWSVGASSLLQNFTYRSHSGGGGSQRRDWYYVPTLLNSITLNTRAGLLAGGHLTNDLAPSTPYAQAILPPGHPPITQCPAEGRPDLFRHNTLVMRQQAAALSAGGPAGMHASVRTATAGAQTRYAGLPVVTPEEAGGFLDAWAAVL